MISWQLHNGFERDFKKLAKKQCGLEEGLAVLKKLLNRQFDSECQAAVIAPGKIHHIKTDDLGWEIWKVEMMVKGLRPNQWPRVWFAVKGDTITFLAIRSHVDNYENNEMDALAEERYGEVE